MRKVPKPPPDRVIPEWYVPDHLKMKEYEPNHSMVTALLGVCVLCTTMAIIVGVFVLI